LSINDKELTASTVGNFTPVPSTANEFCLFAVFSAVNPKAFCFELNVVQSAELKAPLFAALAVGKLNVCVLVEEDIPKSVPVVPVAKFCTCAVNPFNAVKPVENVVIT
jgi:hypothetical protein